MASSRLITSSIWDDDWFGQLSFFEQTLWIGLFSRCADDQGRLLDNAVLIRAAVFPYKDVAIADLEAALAKFASAGRLYRYQADGKGLIQLRRWWQHQQQQWAQHSRWPAPASWVDHVRTRINNHYVEEEWSGKGGNALANREWAPTGEDVIPRCPAASPERSPEPVSCAVHVGRHDPDPDPDPDHTAAHAAAPGAAARTFPEWQQALKDADHRRRPDLVRLFMQTYLPNNELPEHGYIAKSAKAVGGWGRMLDLLWQQVPRPPTGDVLAFVLRVHEHRGNGRDSPRASPVPLERKVADIPKGWLQEPFDPEEEPQL